MNLLSYVSKILTKAKRKEDGIVKKPEIPETREKKPTPPHEKLVALGLFPFTEFDPVEVSPTLYEGWNLTGNLNNVPVHTEIFRIMSPNVSDVRRTNLEHGIVKAKDAMWAKAESQTKLLPVGIEPSSKSYEKDAWTTTVCPSYEAMSVEEYLKELGIDPSSVDVVWAFDAKKQWRYWTPEEGNLDRVERGVGLYIYVLS